LRLAEHLHKTKREILDGMDCVELAEWRAKEAIDGPVGCRRWDLAIVRALTFLALTHCNSQSAMDHLWPEWLRPEIVEKEPSEEDLKAQWEAAKSGFGAVGSRQ
jgi:hypothetical protein